MQSTFVFVIAMAILIGYIYYLALYQISRETRDVHMEVLNFIIPILTLFTVLVAVLTYLSSTKQSQDSRELTFGFNNETRLANIMNSIASCGGSGSSTSDGGYCSQTLFKSQNDTLAFYILETLENALVQKKYKATSEYDVRWLNIVRKFMKENPWIVEYWKTHQGYYSPETNAWIESEMAEGFKPIFVPLQQKA